VACWVETANGDILIGTVEGTFRSSDNGLTWFLSENGMIGGYVTDLFRHPSGFLLASGFDRTNGETRLYRSNDNGLNWTEIPNVPGWLDPASNPKQWGVANSSGDLFAAGSRFTGDYVVIRSTNNGSSWTIVRTISILNANVITDLAISTVDTIFIGVGLGGNLQGMHRSGNNGQTWTRVFTTAVDAIFVDTNDDLYIVSGQRVHRSTNHGTTWSEIYGPSSLPSNWDVPLSVMAKPAGNVFLGTGGTNAGGVGIARSTNGGAAWAYVQSGLPGSSNPIFSHARVLSLFSHSSNKLLCGIDEVAVRLSATGNAAGVYSSANNGDTWNESNSGLLAARMRRVQVLSNGDLMAAPFSTGLLYSGDGGMNWTDRSPLTSGNPHMIEAIGQSPADGAVYAGGQGRVFRSTDLGVSWTNVSSVDFVLFINGIDVHPNGDVLVAHEGGVTNGFFKSTNNGSTWTRIWQSGTGNNIHVAPNGSIFGIGSGRIYRSDNNGTTWTELTNGIGSGVGRMTITPNNTLYASLSGSGGAVIRRSNDNGSTWVGADNGIPRGTNGNFGATVFALRANAVGHVFAYAKYKDLQDANHYDMFRTTDGGSSWHILSSGIVGPYTEVNDISLNPQNGIAYLAATNGIYSSAQSTTSVEGLSDGPPARYELAQNYPNPFNPETAIRFSVAERVITTLEVFNTVGQRIALLYNGIADPGRNYNLVLSGSSLATGVYFYRLVAGGYSSTKKLLLLK
jgi:hypothetical protein